MVAKEVTRKVAHECSKLPCRFEAESPFMFTAHGSLLYHDCVSGCAPTLCAVRSSEHTHCCTKTTTSPDNKRIKASSIVHQRTCCAPDDAQRNHGLFMRTHDSHTGPQLGTAPCPTHFSSRSPHPPNESTSPNLWSRGKPLAGEALLWHTLFSDTRLIFLVYGDATALYPPSVESVEISLARSRTC